MLIILSIINGVDQTYDNPIFYGFSGTLSSGDHAYLYFLLCYLHVELNVSDTWYDIYFYMKLGLYYVCFGGWFIYFCACVSLFSEFVYQGVACMNLGTGCFWLIVE